jgi:peptidoglycan-associated lipoprotein
MKNALKISGIIFSLVLLASFIGCPKKVVKHEEPIPPPEQPTTPVIQEPITPVTLAIQTALNSIYFDFDKSDIRIGDAGILKTNAQVLKDNPTANIIIEGNCDPVGTAEYNMALGWRRANAAQDYLMKLGIEKSRISTVSYGEERLVSQKEDEFWKDRRCDFIAK